MTAITRGISLMNFIITSTALTFQVTVLYPWHKQLDESFEALKKEHHSVLQKVDRFRIHEGKEIREQIGDVSAAMKKQEI